MIDKLELYKEIVELDPNSRVFFTYAQLLEKESRIDEALDALALGLEKQPDYIEARLYYIDLLARNDKLESAHIQLNKFTEIFKKYPGFWYTWSTLTASENPTISSTLALLSTFFTNPTISFVEILQAGIEQYQSGKISAPSSSSNGTSSNGQTEEKAEPLKENPEKVQTPADIIQAQVLLEEDSLHNLDIDTQSEISSAEDFVVLLAEPKQSELENNVFDELNDESSPKASIQTRSMADLLAEQGDTVGAVKIYSELLERADGVEKAELINRIQALKDNKFEKIEAITIVEEPKSTPEKTKGMSTRMQTMLGNLATRLEKRATIQ